MKLFTGWMLAAGLVFCGRAGRRAAAPDEAGRPPYTPASDVGGPYAADAAGGRPLPRPVRRCCRRPRSIPCVRENGFSPLGIPQQRGYIYTIAVIDRGGEDGRLMIDARNGRIIRFVPAYRIGGNFNDDLAATYGPPAPSRPIVRGAPRPPAADPACREPHRAGAEAEPARAAKPAAQPAAAIGGGAAEAGRRASSRPAGRRHRHRPGQARCAGNSADPGNAEGAGAGVTSSARRASIYDVQYAPASP